MKMVIVGSGWLGKPLAEKMWDEGHEVFAVYRSNKPEVKSAIELIKSDDLDKLKLNLAHAEVVVFCFPAPRLNPDNKGKEGRSHAEICLDLVDYCNTDCRFIFTSTTGVYPDKDGAFDETAELDPSNKHVKTERQLRQVLGDRLTIVRLAGLVGEGRFPAKAMAASGKVYNGNEYCNLIHLDDAVGIIAFLIRENLRVEVVNACAPEHPMKGEYYTDMSEKLGVPMPQFEQGPTGKMILSDLSVALGYEYRKPDPYSFY